MVDEIKKARSVGRNNRVWINRKRYGRMGRPHRNKIVVIL
jgi:hypothetical protein